VRLLLDETLGRSVAAVLRQGGHDVVRSSQVAGPGIPDDELFETAVADDRALVTLDERFADADRFDPSGSAGIVVVSLPDVEPDDDRLPFDRMQSAVVDAHRAVADLASERRRIQDEVARLVDREGVLRAEADRAEASGREADLRRALEQLADNQTELARRRALQAQLASQESEMLATAEELARRAQAARVQFELDRAQLLIEEADVVAPGDPVPPPPEAGEPAVRFTGSLVDGAAMEAQDQGLATRRSAGAEQAAIFQRLVAVWGSLARDLAGALSQLLTALMSSDPRGRLWVAGVDGVEQYRDSE
jgi:predicted nuclease of predicted toxin-antitoxin system